MQRTFDRRRLANLRNPERVAVRERGTRHTTPYCNKRHCPCDSLLLVKGVPSDALTFPTLVDTRSPFLRHESFDFGFSTPVKVYTFLGLEKGLDGLPWGSVKPVI